MIWLFISIALSAGGITGMWIAGGSSRWRWAWPLGMQALWFTYTIGTKQWGLIPGCAAYTLVYTINLKKSIRTHHQLVTKLDKILRDEDA